MLFVLSYKDWNVVKPGAWLARAPPGAQESQDLSPILSMRLALTAGSHSQSGQCPGRLEARSEAYSVLSLKPKQDYLISLTVTLWTVAHQTPRSMGFSRQEYWSGLPCPPPGDLPDPGIKSTSPVVPALQVWGCRSV